MSSEKTEKTDKIKITLESANLVYTWKWNITNELCSICRCELQEECIECQAEINCAASGCHIAWGCCGHAFHQHCIFRWLKRQQKCPLDMSEWSTEKIT